ncbi:MAG: hypothetical protein AB7P04_15645 [Bacteriovoracia bacterium]
MRSERRDSLAYTIIIVGFAAGLLGERPVSAAPKATAKPPAKASPASSPSPNETTPAPSSTFERKGTRWGLLPIGNYSTDFGFTFGLLARRFDYGQSGVQPFENLTTFQGQYASGGAKDFLLSYEQTNIFGSTWRGALDLYYARNEFRSYFGVGDHTTLPATSPAPNYFSYAHQMGYVHVAGRKKISELFDLELGVSENFSLSHPASNVSKFGEDFGPTPVRATYTAFNTGLVIERRDSEFIPSKGYFAAASVTFTPGFLGNIDSWARLNAVYKRFDSFIDDRWLYLASEVKFAAASVDAPVHEKARLGSWGTLRGMAYNRYLSNFSGSLRTELRTLPIRWEIFGLPLKIGGGIFAETGKIGDSFGRIFTNTNHFAWGLTGFGSYFTDDFVGSADLGFYDGNTAFYIQLGHSI